MKTMEQFRSELIANMELAEKLREVKNDRELEAFLKENEVDCTNEQFKEFMHAEERNELTEDELKAVAGGGWSNCDKGYSSGKWPKFSANEVVKYKIDDKLVISTVIDVMKTEKGSYDMGGLFNLEFRYIIRTHSDGKRVDNVYESELEKI